MDLLNEFLRRDAESSRPIMIHIIGDSMIDEDYEASVSRISPECSNINVLDGITSHPVRVFGGGAANVYCQLKNFNTWPRLFSLVDSSAFSILKELGIKWWGYVKLPDGCYNPVKKRFYDGDFQVGMRWDIEHPSYNLGNLLSKYQQELYKTWLGFQAEADVIIFSDYNKGIFHNSGLYPNLPSIPTIVDPKKGPALKWKGCTIFKPNAKEAEALSGLTCWKDQCDFFKEELNCQAVVITQAGNGVVGKTNDYFEYRPQRKIDPFQVIGAGDCFVAMLALAIVHEFSVVESVEIAFEISTLYVQQKHRSCIRPANLGVKLVKPSSLKDRDFKLVFTNGCFDLLHSGHLKSLKFAKSKGDKLVVALNSDESIQRAKGVNRPILPLIERVEIISALECVDFVVTFDEDRPQKLIEEIMPDVLVKGEDWKEKDIAGSDIVKEIYFVPLIEGRSTTSIIEAIKNEEKVTTTNKEIG